MGEREKKGRGVDGGGEEGGIDEESGKRMKHIGQSDIIESIRMLPNHNSKDSNNGDDDRQVRK